MISKKQAEKYCCEDISLIENYDKAINDNDKTWHLHHKLEIELNKSINELKELHLYYNRPASELIFLTPSEHHHLHNNGSRNPFYNKQHSEENKRKISKANKGNKNWNKGLSKEKQPFYNKQHSEETKKKMSISAKKPKKLYKWITPSGDIIEMCINSVKHYHKDWILFL